MNTNDDLILNNKKSTFFKHNPCTQYASLYIMKSRVFFNRAQFLAIIPFLFYLALYVAQLLELSSTNVLVKKGVQKVFFSFLQRTDNRKFYQTKTEHF